MKKIFFWFIVYSLWFMANMPAYSESASLSKSNLKNHRKVCPLSDAGRQLIQTPWGEVQTPMAILPYFYCPKCNKDVNLGDCEHRQDYTAPQWIRQFNLWKKGKIEVKGELLEKFVWLINNSVVFSDGFESGDLSAWSGTTTQPAGSSYAASTENPNEGTYSGKSNTAADPGIDWAMVYYDFVSVPTELYLRFYVRLNEIPANTAREGLGGIGEVVSWNYPCAEASILGGTGGQAQWGLRYNINGGAEAGTVENATAETINAGQYYCVEVHFITNASTGVAELWVDGTSKISKTGLDTTGITNEYIRIGSLDLSGFQGYTVWNDSLIADSTSYIGPIKHPALIKDALINDAMIR